MPGVDLRRALLLGRENETHQQVIVQVGADPRRIDDRRDVVLAQMLRRSDARQHQELRRLQSAGADHDLSRCREAPLLPIHRRHDAATIAAADVELRHCRSRQQRQILPRQRRQQVGVRRRNAPHVHVDVDVLLAGGIADARDIVDVHVPGLAERDRRGDEGMRHRMRQRGLARRDHAVAATDRTRASREPLGLLEVADDRLVAPGGAGRRLPGVVVGLVALEPDRGVDARAATDDLADWRDDDAIVERLLRCRLVAPVGVGAEIPRVDARIVDFLLIEIGAAALDHQHAGLTVLREAVRHHAACGARADHDVVVLGAQVGELHCLVRLRGLLRHVARDRGADARRDQHFHKTASIDVTTIGSVDHCVDGIA